MEQSSQLPPQHAQPMNQASQMPETAGMSALPPAPTGATPPPAYMQPAPATDMAPAVPASTPPASAQPAGESEWIDKARQIIGATQDDPFAQTEQLYALRVQYMQTVHSREMQRKGGSV